MLIGVPGTSTGQRMERWGTRHPRRALLGTGPEGPQPGMEETHRGFLGEVRFFWTLAGFLRLTFQAKEIAETQVHVWKVGLIRQREAWPGVHGMCPGGREVPA